MHFAILFNLLKKLYGKLKPEDWWEEIICGGSEEKKEAIPTSIEQMFLQRYGRPFPRNRILYTPSHLNESHVRNLSTRAISRENSFMINS